MTNLEVSQIKRRIPQAEVVPRLKIAFVVHDYHRSGGHSRYVAELATRFSEDHEIHVFANAFESDGSPGVHFHKVPAWRLNALTTILSFAIPAMSRVGRDFDIVHVQGYCGPRGNVVTTHMCNDAWFRALFTQGEPPTWRDRIFHLITTALERKLYRKTPAKQVIAISRLVARNVAELYQCEVPKHIIYHGVDLATFSPATRKQLRSEERLRLGIPEDETVFLFVGNLRKGAKQCLRALARIDSGVLLLVSPTPAGPYEALAEELGCRSRALFPGPTNRVERAYAAADVLVFPTPYDAFGLTITEAMACGLPVVTSREAGASELILHGKNGLLLENAANDAELADCMQQLRGNRSLMVDLGVTARKTVEGFSWDSVAELTMQVYQQTVVRRR